MNILPDDFYLPRTNVHEMLCFDPENENSHTASQFVNHFLRLFFEDTEQDAKTIAKRMGVTYTDLRIMLKVEARTTFSEFHDYWMAYRLNVAIALDPTLTGDKLAAACGFKSRSAVWLFYNSKRYKKIAREMDGVIFPKPSSQRHHC